MKKIPLILICLIAVLGCDISKYVNTNKNEPANTKPSPTVEPKPSQTAVAEPTPKPGIIAVLKKSAGKYPREIKLLDNEEMRSRLKKLMGPDFAAMKANWNVETPIEISGGVLMTSGCQQHNCADNHYYLFVDLENDNINVYHLENGKQTYFEGERIDLPSKFAAETSSDN